MKDDPKTKKQLIDELTELRLQNAALKESESADKYRSLVENIKDVIYELDSQGVILYISPAVRDMLGFDSTEIIGKKFTELAYADDLSRLEEWFSELCKGRETPSEYRVSDKSGQLRWAQTRVSPIMEDDQFRGARGILIDVTEQKHAEECLRKSEEKYRSVFDNSIMGISQTLRDGRLIAVNNAYAKMYGYANTEEMMTEVSSAWQLYANPEEREDVLRILTEKGVMKPREITVIRRDGTQFAVLAGTQEIRDSKGNLRYYQAEQIDVTERKQAEKALQESEEKYRWVLNNMVDVITVMDMNLLFTYVSPSIMRMRGYTAEEAVAQTFEQVMTPESLQISARVFEEEMQLEASGTADPDRVRILEVEQYKKDGSIVWMENHLSFMRDEAQKPVGIIAVTHDISERKEAEDKIKKQTDAMEAAIDGIAILNKDEEYTYLNHAHVSIYGYENAGELIGKPWRTLYDADEIKRFDAEIMPKFGQTGYWQGEALGMKKDGTKFPQEISLTVLENGGLICIVRDITARKRAEEVLRDNRALLSNALEMAHLGHWEYDVPNDLFTFNDQFYKIFRTTAEQVGGYTMSSTEYAHRFVHPDDVYLVTEETRKAIETTDLFFNRQIEHRMLYADGTVGYIAVRFFIVKDAHGRTVKTYGVNQDITERKQAEEASKKSENKYRLLADNVNDVIFVLDMDLNYTYVSPSVEVLRGYKPEKVLHQSAAETLTPSSLDLAMSTLSEVIELGKSGHGDIGESRTIELEMWRKDGTTVWTEVKVSFIRDEDEQPMGILGVTRDITKRKLAEEKLRQTLENLRLAVNTTIQVIISTVEARDPYTANHQLRVANLARAIATEMELSPERIEGIWIAGSIHDLGKISIPAEILSKPGKITENEFSLIKEHSRKGYDILKNVESSWPLAEIVYQHHERMDGSGYPRNLKGNAILMEARILAVSDVIEAMASHRPYRAALGIDDALKEIEDNRGILYDAAVVDASLRLFREKGYQCQP